ncbi:MAG: hypothetical protein ABH854_00275 [Candidatus Diapherotrites archaeon]|nr:hypothetical protein [Candidatus Micrarchaeota archaeon]
MGKKIKGVKMGKEKAGQNRERKKLVNKLLKMPVKCIRFFGGKISFDFFGHKIGDKIVIKKEDHVAEWSRRHREVFIDRKFGKREMGRSFKALALHEAVEKFLVEKYGLKLDEEAHVVATRKEKELLEKLGGNWRSHELTVYWDWHRQGEH